MTIFDPGPRQISDYISDINALIVSLNVVNATSIPLVRAPFGGSEMLLVLNQTVQAINSALNATLPYFSIPLDASAFLSMINSLSIIAAGASNVIPPWAYVGSTIDLDIANNRFWGSLPNNFSVARVGANATDLLPTSASGASYQTFAANTFRNTSGLGMLCEESRINYLLNSIAPATQTTQSLATGTYVLWVNGSGSATPSGGTATITGAAAATNGSPNVFTVTVAGTVTVTVSGSLNAFQLELGGAASTYGGSSLIVTGGAIGVRAADNIAFTNTAFNIVSSTAFTAIFNCKRMGPNFNQANLIGSGANGAFILEDHDPGQLSSGLTNVAFLVQNTPVLDTTFRKVGSTLNPGLNALKITGGSLGTSANATLAVADTLYGLGNKASAFYFNGYFGRITMFATPLSSAALDGLI